MPEVLLLVAAQEVQVPTPETLAQVPLHLQLLEPLVPVSELL